MPESRDAQTHRIDPEMARFGAAVRNLRKSKRASSRQFIDALEVKTGMKMSSPSFNNRERGVSAITVVELEAFLQVLDISPNEFFESVPESVPHVHHTSGTNPFLDEG